jgi:hypothetical protein
LAGSEQRSRNGTVVQTLTIMPPRQSSNDGLLLREGLAETSDVGADGDGGRRPVPRRWEGKQAFGEQESRQKRGDGRRADTQENIAQHNHAGHAREDEGAAGHVALARLATPDAGHEALHGQLAAEGAVILRADESRERQRTNPVNAQWSSGSTQKSDATNAKQRQSSKHLIDSA